MLKVISKSVPLVVLVAGCNVLRARAATDLSCPEEQVKLTPLDDNGHQMADGCGRQAMFQYGLNMHLDGLQKRAAFDLSCPVEQVKISTLSKPSEQGAEGCGHRATYLFGLTSPYEYGWVLNNASSVQGASGAPAAAPPAH